MWHRLPADDLKPVGRDSVEPIYAAGIDRRYSWSKLIRLVFFDRLCPANLLGAVRFDGAPARAAVCELRSRFVELLKHIGDHRRGCAAAMNLAADFSLVNCGKRILGLIRR